jgi:hypothetical protein
MASLVLVARSNVQSAASWSTNHSGAEFGSANRTIFPMRNQHCRAGGVRCASKFESTVGPPGPDEHQAVDSRG